MKHYYAKLLATTSLVMASSLTSQASASLDEPGSRRTFVSMKRSSAARTEIDYYRDGASALFRDISEQRYKSAKSEYNPLFGIKSFFAELMMSFGKGPKSA